MQARLKRKWTSREAEANNQLSPIWELNALAPEAEKKEKNRLRICVS